MIELWMTVELEFYSDCFLEISQSHKSKLNLYFLNYSPKTIPDFKQN